MQETEKDKENQSVDKNLTGEEAGHDGCTCSGGGCCSHGQELSESEQEAERAQPDARDDEIRGLKDQLLRVMADAENTRKRAQKEALDARKYAVTNFAKEMLVVSDNFRRALDSLPKDADQDAVKQMVEGIEATERQLLSALDKFGIKAMDPIGKVFDPHYHQVMIEIEDLSQPPGTVLQVMQQGYMIEGRLLREALVAVAKGAPMAQHVDTEA